MGNFFEDVGRTGVLKETIGGILSNRQQEQENAIAKQNQDIQLQELDILKSQEARAAQDHQAKVDKSRRLRPLSLLLDNLGEESGKMVLGLFKPGTTIKIGNSLYAPEREFAAVKETMRSSYELTLGFLDNTIIDAVVEEDKITKALANTEKPLKGEERANAEKKQAALKLQIADSRTKRDQADSAHTKRLAEIEAQKTPQETSQQKIDRATKIAQIQADIKKDPVKAKTDLIKMLADIAEKKRRATKGDISMFGELVPGSSSENAVKELTMLETKLKGLLVEAEAPELVDAKNAILDSGARTDKDMLKAILELEIYSISEAKDILRTLKGMGSV